MKAYTSRRTALVGACALVMTPIWALPAQATPENDNVVINELYLRGGSNNQPYTHKFVELYNPTDAEISLDGMSLQYFSSKGADASNNVSLEGYSIEAGGYFLVRGGTNGSNGEAVPNVDLVAGGLNPGGANGAIALVDGSADVDGVAAGDVSGNENFIDFVGYGKSVEFETEAASYDGGNSDPGSITRTDGLDTDDNSADFDFVTVPAIRGYRLLRSVAYCSFHGDRAHVTELVQQAKRSHRPPSIPPYRFADDLHLRRAQPTPHRAHRRPIWVGSRENSPAGSP